MRKVKLYALGFIYTNLIWAFLFILLDKPVIPNPVDVYASFSSFFQDGLAVHMFVSLFRIFAGIAISLMLGITIGYLMTQSNKWSRVLTPLVYFTYPIPKTALLPIIMILFGLGDCSKVILIVLIINFQVIVTVRDGILNISKEYIDCANNYGASRMQTFWFVILPSVLPEVLTSIRLSIGTALAVLFFAEGYGTSMGLGYFILDAWSIIDYEKMFRGIIVLGLVGVSLFIIIDWLENRILDWR